MWNERYHLEEREEGRRKRRGRRRGEEKRECGDVFRLSLV